MRIYSPGANIKIGKVRKRDFSRVECSSSEAVAVENYCNLRNEIFALLLSHQFLYFQGQLEKKIYKKIPSDHSSILK